MDNISGEEVYFPQEKQVEVATPTKDVKKDVAKRKEGINKWIVTLIVFIMLVVVASAALLALYWDKLFG